MRQTNYIFVTMCLVVLICNAAFCQNQINLEICSETEWFSISCTKQDSVVINDIITKLESGYKKISADLQCPLTQKIKIKIYPDLQTFHLALKYPNAPDWAVANTSSSNLIEMVSPQNPGPTQSYNTMLNVVVHELTHIIQLQINPNIPVWLGEGIATFEAEQMYDSRKEFIIKRVKENKIPSIAHLNSAGNQWSYTIVEFAVKEYGIEKIPLWIKNGGNIQATFNISQSKFFNKWEKHLKQVYKVKPNEENKFTSSYTINLD